MRYYKKIVGERLYLSPINTDDAEQYTKWLNDPEIADLFGQFREMISLNNEKKILEQMSNEGHNYAIVLKDGDTLIGNISLMDVDHVYRRATLGIFIGADGYLGKGYGAEAIRLILDYGFNILNLHNIMLTVFADNPRGLACYRKVGFKEFGRRRETRLKNGKYIDIVYMDILESEFRTDV